jgi:hypothetical protein
VKQAKNQKREVGMKVTAGSQRRWPHLFIGVKLNGRKILNLTVKRSASRAFEVFQARHLGTDAWEDVFLCLDSRSLGFAGSGSRQGKRFAIEGLLLGGFRIKPFVYQK